MALDAKQREQIVKIMGMTGSTNDHEALAHLRRAQKILDANKMTWMDLLTNDDFTFIRLVCGTRRPRAGAYGISLPRSPPVMTSASRPLSPS